MKNRKDFLKVFRMALGNVSVACKNYGIERQTFYNWYNKYEDFKKAVEDVKEERKDFIESNLDKRIQAGDTTAIIFALKTFCKDRGYAEQVENKITIQAEQPLFGDYDESKEC